MREFEILRKEVITDDIKIFELYCPIIATHCRPGQFLIVMVHEEGERIPLTIADFDAEKETVEIVFQEVGKSTIHLGTLNEGDLLYAVVGPFGMPPYDYIAAENLHTGARWIWAQGTFDVSKGWWLFRIPIRYGFG